MSKVKLVKEPKIIKEKVNALKEIEKDIQEEEENLENVIEDSELDDAFSGERLAPTLQDSGQSQTIEQQVADAPSQANQPKERNERAYDESSPQVYNMQDYAGSGIYENERRTEEATIRINRDILLGSEVSTPVQPTFSGYPDSNLVREPGQDLRQYHSAPKNKLAQDTEFQADPMRRRRGLK